MILCYDFVPLSHRLKVKTSCTDVSFSEVASTKVEHYEVWPEAKTQTSIKEWLRDVAGFEQPVLITAGREPTNIIHYVDDLQKILTAKKFCVSSKKMRKGTIAWNKSK